MARFMGLLGLLTMMLLAYAFSTNRRAIRLKTILWGLGLQFAFALIILRLEAGRAAIRMAGDAINRLLEYSFAGSEFVFGELGKSGSKLGMVFAFQVLTTIIFVSAFFAILYHFGVMQFVIKQVAKVMTRLMGASGAESLNVAASIFMGQTEAPLSIRPFLPKCTKSELMTIMTAGMAHVSGGIMGAYILYGIEARHLLAAVIMTAPGTILIAKMLVPETETPLTARRESSREESAGGPEIDIDSVEMPKDANVLGAISRGTTDGMHLALNVGAMLVAFLALIALANGILGGIHGSLTRIAGFLVPVGHAIHLRSHLRAGGFRHRHSLEGLCQRRQSARHPHGDQRTRGLFAARADEIDPRSALVYDSDVRLVRVRQLQLHRDPDRRHRSPGPQQARRPGPPRFPRHAGRYHGQPDVGFDRGNADQQRLSGGMGMAMNGEGISSARTRRRNSCSPARGNGRKSGWCSDRGWARSRMHLPMRYASPTRRFHIIPVPAPRGMPGS